MAFRFDDRDFVVFGLDLASGSDVGISSSAGLVSAGSIGITGDADFAMASGAAGGRDAANLIIADPLGI